MIIVENNWSKYIIYNEFFNENILSGFKLNENTTMLTIEKGQEYDIIYNPNSIAIVSINSTYGYELTRILELQFDENSKRLLTSNNKRFNDGVLDYEYSYFFEYEYDNFGKLEHIYKIYNSEKILIKSIFYDGMYRTISRPFFNTFDEMLPDKEIVIYENNKIKYYVKTHPQENDHASSDIVEKEEARCFLLIIEYDENGNETMNTIFREKSEYFDESIELYSIKNEEYDHNNNWIRQNVYWLPSPDGEDRLIGTYIRRIDYD